MPATLIPVPVTVNTLALPATPKLILPALAGILMLLVPLANTPMKLPLVVFPFIAKLVSVPKLVMFG